VGSGGVNAARDWYQIRYGDQGNAWIYAELLIPSADVSILSVESAPARPTAIPEPEAAAPASAINLRIQDIVLRPDPLVCDQPGSVSVRIENVGSEDTAHGAEVAFKMIHVESGTTTVEFNASAVFSAVNAGATVTSSEVDVTTNVYFGEDYRITATILSEGFFVESDLSDNSRSKTFELQRGNC
jgi:hypothetical protein